MNWDIIELGDEVELITKGTTPTSIGHKFSTSGIPFLRAQNVINGVVSLKDDILYINHETHNTALSRSRIKVNDVLLTIAGTIGRTAIVKMNDNEANCNQAIAIIRIGNSKLKPEYLCRYLSTSSAKNQFNKGKVTATISNLSLTQIKKLKIPLPPLPIQKKIAAILDAADDYRKKTKALLDKYDLLTQSIFLDMFGDPVRNEKGWEVVKLNELVSKLGDGIHGTPNYDSNGDYFFINGNNLRNRGIEFNEKTKKVTKDEFLKHKRELNYNTMLVSINGSIGKVGFYRNEKVMLGKSVCYFNIIEGSINPKFLAELIDSNYFIRYIKKQQTGSTIKNVSLKSMRNFPVLNPPIKIQNEFERRLNFIEIQKNKLSDNILKSELLFKALLQKAFNGELVK